MPVPMKRPDTLDYITVPDVAVAMHERHGWVRLGADETPTPGAVPLRGKALEMALRDAGLPSTGTADEKRARIAAHLATTTTNTTPSAPEEDA